MAVHTAVLDFYVAPALMDDADLSNKLKQDLENVMKRFEFQLVHSTPIDTSGFLLLFEGPNGSHASVRGYSHGLMTLTTEECIDNNQVAISSSKKSKELDCCIKQSIKVKKMRRLPPVKRGSAINVYSTSSDDRLLEYDFIKVLFEMDSPYQNIKIFNSPSFGNVLLLDDLQNIAESDLIYTQTLMRYGIEDYNGKTVLILGGGDGGLLHELLKEDPAFITMIEIDKNVLDACRQHLRGVCGSCLDKLKGDHYEIIVDDCAKVMQQYYDEGKTFDYVISDLTDIPITLTPQGEMWDFIRKILELSFGILSPKGKFLTHGNGINSIAALSMFEEQLLGIGTPVEFLKHTAFVPSFMEMWVFYEAWKSTEENAITNGK